MLIVGPAPQNVYNGPVIVISNVKDLKVVNPTLPNDSQQNNLDDSQQNNSDNVEYSSYAIDSESAEDGPDADKKSPSAEVESSYGNLSDII